VPIWGSKPEEEKPERKKVSASYVKTPPPSPSPSKFYLLARDAEIVTPLGTVEALSGDILEARDSGLWVLAKEVLNAAGVIIKPKSDGH